jgi:hypothetical protein
VQLGIQAEINQGDAAIWFGCVKDHIAGLDVAVEATLCVWDGRQQQQQQVAGEEGKGREGKGGEGSEWVSVCRPSQSV